MSAIYGIINFDGRPVNPEDFEVMGKELNHWGHEGTQTYVDGDVALGLKLTCVSPESKYEKQPLEYGPWLILMAGRFFQREKLAQQIGIADIDLSRTPDSYVLAKAYEKWGENCVQHFLGEFTFFIWDTKKQVAFAASDHISQFPLFYYWQNQTLAFATSLNAIYNLSFVAKEQDIEFSLERSINPFLEQREKTHIKEIQVLPLGHSIKFALHLKQLHHYWKPEFKGYRKTTVEETARDMLALIAQCVADRIRTEYPVFSSLSGGLDSSTITCLAARQLAANGRPLYTSGFVLPKERYDKVGDELPYMMAVVAQESNIEFEPTTATIPSLEKVLSDAHKLLLPPQFKPDYWGEMSRIAASKNARVMLTGYLGDDTVSRKPRNHIAELIRNGKICLAWKLNRQIGHNSGWSKYVQYKQYAKELKRAFPKLIRTYNSKQHLDTDWFKARFLEFINPKYHDKALIWLFKRDEIGSVMNSWRTLDVLNLVANQGHNLGNYHTNIIHHQNGMYCSHVFTDKRLIDFCLSVPPEHWLYNGISRGLLRLATVGILPEKIRLRKSKGFLLYESRDFYNHNLAKIKARIESIELSEQYKMINFINLKRHLQYNNESISSDDLIKLNNILLPILSEIIGAKPVPN